MGCVGVRSPAGGVLSLAALPSPCTSNFRKCAPTSCGRISTALDCSSSSSSTAPSDRLPLLRVSQSRCCSSSSSSGSLWLSSAAQQCSSSGRLPSSEQLSSSDLKSDFVFNELLSSHLIRAANSRLGQKKSRRRNFEVHAKSKNDDPPPVYRLDFRCSLPLCSSFPFSPV